MTSRRLTCSLATALAAASLGAPAAIAMPDYPTGPQPSPQSAAVATAPEPAPPAVVEADDSSGFDWGSAAVGAAAIAAIALLAGAAVRTLGRIRPTGGEAR